MRKKWGMILGLTGMVILGSQGVYAAETTENTETELFAEDKKAESSTEESADITDDIEDQIKKGGFSAGASVHDPSIIKDHIIMRISSFIQDTVIMM